MNKGIVIKNMNGYYYIQDELGTIHECKVRGRLKKSRYSLLVGDRVEFSEKWLCRMYFATSKFYGSPCSGQY